MKKILFVCLGNICRSPLAEGIAQKMIDEQGLDFNVDSAGTSNWHEGETPCQNSIQIAKTHGIDISKQRSRPVSRDDMQTFDLIVAMDAQNKADLETMGFKNVRLLGEFGGYHGTDVPDPYYFHGVEGFEKVYSMIETCVTDLLDTL